MKKYFLISLLLHLLFFLYVMSLKPVKKEASPTEVMIDITEVKKPSNDKAPSNELRDQEKAEQVEAGDIKKPVFECTEDKPHYEGIGIMTEYRDGITRVTHVAQGYPAEEAGIMVGDVIVSYDQDDLRGPKGTPVSVLIWRDNANHVFRIVRGIICYED